MILFRAVLWPNSPEGHTMVVLLFELWLIRSVFEGAGLFQKSSCFHTHISRYVFRVMKLNKIDTLYCNCFVRLTRLSPHFHFFDSSATLSSLFSHIKKKTWTKIYKLFSRYLIGWPIFHKANILEPAFLAQLQRSSSENGHRRQTRT